jgi:hypothetical protein
MARTQQNLFKLVALMAPGVLIACGSSGGTGTGGTTTTHSTGGHATTTTTTTGTGGGDAGPSCNSQCISMYPTAFAKFEGYLLEECGCSHDAGAPPCAAMCSAADCMATMMSQVSMACTTCLETEAGKGLSSMCTVKAAETDCATDTSCKAFSACGICCATSTPPKPC